MELDFMSLILLWTAVILKEKEQTSLDLKDESYIIDQKDESYFIEWRSEEKEWKKW